MKHNFRMFFSYKNSLGDRIQGSKNFYSNKDVEFLFKSLHKKFGSEGKGNNKVRFGIRDLIEASNNRSDTFYVSNDVLDGGIKSKFFEIKHVCNLKDMCYRVVVDNCDSNVFDRKSMTIQCTDSLDVVFNKIKKLLHDIIEDQKDDFVVFTTRQHNSTHRIMVHKSGHYDDYTNLNSKWFSIKFPNFSSSEVIELMVNKIKGEK